VLDAPIDAWYGWLGVAVASVAVLGVVAAVPAAPAPDADGLAATVDRVAAAEAAATAEHGVAAGAVRVAPGSVALRGEAGVARATFVYGPVTPATDDARLERVLGGEPPDRVFDSPETFAGKAAAAREREPTWQPSGGRIRIRRVHWGEVDVTLVG